MKRAALIVAVILLGSAVPGCAEPVDDAPKSQELNQIQSKLKQANESAAQIKAKREELIAQLQRIEKQYGDTVGSLHELGLQIGSKQQRIKKLSKDMEKRQTDLKLQSDELSKQIKAAFVMGRKEQLRLLLNQQDSALASRMMVYYHYLNKSRLKKLAALRHNIVLLANLEQEKRRETDSLGQAQLSRQNVQAGLSNAEKQRELLLAQLNQEFNSKSEQLKQMEEDAIASQTLVTKLQQAALEHEKPAVEGNTDQVNLSTETNPLDIDGNATILNGQNPDKAVVSETATDKPFPKLKGRLPWPIKGSIAKKFGSQRSENRWDGVLISAKEGTEVQAVSSGKVVFADWLRGYGLLIIVDHGHGYMSLYAFNQSLYKKVGDRVTAGTVLGAAGKSGGREESGLYFGIRSNGKPVDPLAWCRKG